jgi:hypothetical protein
VNQWARRTISALLLILAVAVAVRLAWELLRPAVPTLIGLLVVLVIVRLIWRRPQGW